MLVQSLRLPEFDHPTLPTKRFRRAFEPVDPEEFACRTGNTPIVFPADDLIGDHIHFDDSDLTLHTTQIPAERDSAFDQTPRILLNAGTHGDEHESMNALASLVRNKELPQQFSYDVIFCANPHGFRQNTRENAQGIDVNRSFFNDAEITPEARAIMNFVYGRKYKGVQDMHEDFEATGTYIYEDVRDFNKSVLAPEIKKALLANNMPLQELNAEFALGPQKGSDRIVHRYEPGVVLADAAAESIAFQSPGMMLTTRMLLMGNANSTLRIETGQTRAPASRVATQKLVVLSALKAMLKNPEHFETPQFTDANLETIRTYFRDKRWVAEGRSSR